jgi:glycosyltransferase involved in cell wall biosynthesis
MKRVWLPSADNNAVGGVGQVIAAQRRHLPGLGWHVVDDPNTADIIAVHISAQRDVPRIDVHHLHGLHYDSDTAADRAVNRKLMRTIREAHAHTIPSEWSAMVLRRDLRLHPDIIPNGIEVANWQPGNTQSYALWNKTRSSRICDPRPAYELASQGVPVVSTFLPDNVTHPDNARVIGRQSFQDMRQIIQDAGVYIATTREVMAVGTLEAMAAGVPILGYTGSGTEEVVTHKATGWLVEEGDIAGLVAGYHWLMEHRAEISRACRETAQAYDWARIIPRYAALYERVLQQREHERTGVSIVIPCYNYGRFLGDAIQSCLKQTEKPAEIIVVDDGSTDNTREIAQRYPVTYIYQENAGPGAARNRGIAHATQPYIVCLDADDWLDRAYVATLRPALHTNRQLGIVYSGITWERPDGARRSSGAPFSWEREVKGNAITCAAMFRREMWERAGGQTSTYKRAEDYEFWLRGLSVGYDAQRVTTDGLFHYRSHPDHKSLKHKYTGVYDWLPWAYDGDYPAGAPASEQPRVRSYRKPQISVIIPVGPGHAADLPTALESLLGQSFRDWEAIVIDDTHDGIPAYLLRPYPFARVLRTSGATGAGAARNVGIDAARASLCLFLDADDYLIPAGLQAFFEGYHNSDACYVYSDWFTWHNGKITPQQCKAYSQVGWLEHGWHAVTVLMHIDHARTIQFDEDLPSWEDWDFFARCAINGICGERIALPLLGYQPGKGARRQYAVRHQVELKSLLEERYRPYISGGKEIMPCCGGKGKQPTPQTVKEGATTVSNTSTTTYVRMEYTGKNTGAVTFSGANGRSYRGGANPTSRFANVHKDDVERMINTRKWKVVNRPRPTVHRGAQPVPPPKPALVAEPGEENTTAYENVPHGMEQYFAVMPDDDVPTTEDEPDEPEEPEETTRASRRRGRPKRA